MPNEELTSHEFRSRYPQAKFFTSLGKAQFHHKTRGGVVWHMTNRGAMVPGWPARGSELLAIAPA